VEGSEKYFPSLKYPLPMNCKEITPIAAKGGYLICSTLITLFIIDRYPILANFGCSGVAWAPNARFRNDIFGLGVKFFLKIPKLFP
jgi:hypothetical protein